MTGKFVPTYEESADQEDLKRRLDILEDHLELVRDYEVKVSQENGITYIRPDDKKTSHSFGREELSLLSQGRTPDCQSSIVKMKYVPFKETSKAQYADNTLELTIRTEENHLEAYILAQLNPTWS